MFRETKTCDRYELETAIGGFAERMDGTERKVSEVETKVGEYADRIENAATKDYVDKVSDVMMEKAQARLDLFKKFREELFGSGPDEGGNEE